MEELIAIKESLLRGDTVAALLLVEELEEMSRDDKISNIRSYAKVLLHHLIKQQVEKRSTKSWQVSIRNSVREIQAKNKRRKSGDYYLNQDELEEILESAYPSAVDTACLEVEEGRYEPEELQSKIDKPAVLNQAIALLLQED